MGGRKNVLVLVGGGVVVLLLLLLLVYVFLQSWVAGLVLLGGLLVVGLILFVFFVIIATKRRKRAQAFEDELAASAAGTGGAGGAAAAARVDELRRRFQEGVETFRKHGKSVYSVPWYVIVGEPGAGKTEAIRHSMIGFPPGLQDEMQGSGGTLNMDWWFSNHAVILDTAGRLVFEDAGGKTGQVWREFLKLLSRARPNCPLNGVMLCIPADSLIRDSIDEVDTKAANIASKLSLIQRELDVRFPVVVVITKADLVNGFREFFDSMDDPSLQHQIVGWSNPAPLDEPFRADEVEDHLLNMQDRLIKRRMGLLYDPKPRERGERVDEVDALYEFPEALVNLAPNLERYLETIFKGGEWAQQPLFLRGIYFASAMQEGAALDKSVADAMGVSMDQLPEGSIWERQRSYFLRDLFVEKMFRERGLVTRASNAQKLKAKRRLALRLVVGAAAVLLIGLSLWAYTALERSIAGQKKFWQSAAEAYGRDPRDQSYPVVIMGDNGPRDDVLVVFAGDENVPVEGADNVAEAPLAVLAKAEDQIRVHPMFKVATLLDPSSTTDNLLRDERREAAEIVFVWSAFEPIVRRGMVGLSQRQPGEFGDAGVGALAELIKLYRSNEEDPPPVDFGKIASPLLGWFGEPGAVVEPEQLEQLEAGVESVDRAFKRLLDLRDDAGGSNAWPRPALEEIRPNFDAALRRSVKRFADGARLTSGPASGSDDPFAVAQRYRTALDAYDALERRIFDAYAPDDGVPKRTTADDWSIWVRDLQTQAAVLDELSGRLGEMTFAAWYTEQVNRSAAGAQTRIQTLLDALGPTPMDEQAAIALADETGAEPPEPTEMERSRQLLRAAAEQLEADKLARIGAMDQLEALHARLMAGSEAGGREYRRRLDIYTRTEAVRSEAIELNRFVDLVVLRARINQGVVDQKRDNSGRASGDPKALINLGVTAANRVLDMATVDRVDELYRLAADADPPVTKVDVEQAVRDAADELGRETLAVPTLPGTELVDGGRLDSAYEPIAAAAVLEAMVGFEEKTSSSQVARMERARQEYAESYIAYWGRLLRDNRVIRVQQIPDWAAFLALKDEIQAKPINDQLTRLLDARIGAIDELPLDEGEWGPRLPDERAQARTALADMARLMGSDEASSLTPWSEAPNDGARAKLWLLRLDQQDFMERVMAPIERTGSGGVEYWGELATGGIQALARAGAGDAELARDRLLTQFAQFPLVALTPASGMQAAAPAAGALTPPQIDQARRDMELAQGAGATAGGAGGFGPGMVGAQDFRVRGNRVVEQALAAMRGNEIDPTQQEKLDKMQAMLNRLRRPQSVTFNWDPDGISGENGNILLLEDGRQRGDGTRGFLKGTPIGSATMPGGEVSVVAGPGAAQQVIANPAGRFGPFPGPWSAMAMVQVLGGETTDGGKTWTIRVSGQGTPEATFGIEFETPIGERESWAKP